MSGVILIHHFDSLRKDGVPIPSSQIPWRGSDAPNDAEICNYVVRFLRERYGRAHDLSGNPIPVESYVAAVIAYAVEACERFWEYAEEVVLPNNDVPLGTYALSTAERRVHNVEGWVAF